MIFQTRIKEATHRVVTHAHDIHGEDLDRGKGRDFRVSRVVMPFSMKAFSSLKDVLGELEVLDIMECFGSIVPNKKQKNNKNKKVCRSKSSRAGLNLRLVGSRVMFSQKVEYWYTARCARCLGKKR